MLAIHLHSLFILLLAWKEKQLTSESWTNSNENNQESDVSWADFSSFKSDIQSFVDDKMENDVYASNSDKTVVESECIFSETNNEFDVNSSSADGHQSES